MPAAVGTAASGHFGVTVPSVKLRHHLEATSKKAYVKGCGDAANIDLRGEVEVLTGGNWDSASFMGNACLISPRAEQLSMSFGMLELRSRIRCNSGADGYSPDGRRSNGQDATLASFCHHAGAPCAMFDGRCPLDAPLMNVGALHGSRTEWRHYKNDDRGR